MQRRLPPLTALRAFEAAARHMSFQAAAVELAVTPTAISHQIRDLEMACGTALFRRPPATAGPHPGRHAAVSQPRPGSGRASRIFAV
jgi:hypothetical protein